MSNQEQTENKPSIKIVVSGGRAEIVEKKSRFIATVKPVTTQEEALEFVESTKKKYWDARHNCSAFVIGSQNEITRCSDDGEPSGTAGRPMLEVLLGAKLHNVAVVVTRYFGGVLLGTGGLVRAYTKAVQEGLAASQVAVQAFGTRAIIETDYNGIGKIQYILAKAGVTVEELQYTDKVTLQIFLLQEQKKSVINEIIEATSGKCIIEEVEDTYTQLACKIESS